MDRYFIDERGGCIAVRDSENTDPEYPGLHRDTQGVMQYWQGNATERKCSKCGHPEFVSWEVPEADRAAAEELCGRLNREETAVFYHYECQSCAFGAVKPVGNHECPRCWRAMEMKGKAK